MFDVVIKNGIIIDGTGSSMQNADIGVKDGEIVEIGDLENEKSEREIDASGKYVVPGFIDVNNHSDTRWKIFSDPGLESLIRQGITTIIGGGCGSSLAPVNNPEMIKSIRKWTDIGQLNINWVTVREFFEELRRNGLAVNFGTLVGHGTIRRGIIGDSTRNLNETEEKMLREIIKNSLEDGAIGLSSGLVYSHAKLAPEKELVDASKVVANYGKIYVTHIREEGSDILNSLSEAIKTAKKSGVKLHISHLKIMGKKNWPLMDKVFRKIEKAEKDGVEISFDVFPYTATGSVLYTFLPDWVSRGGRKIMMKRLKSTKSRKKLIEEMKKDDVDYSKIIIASHSLGKDIAGKVVSDIAKSQEKGVEETVLDLLTASNGRVITITEALDEENLEKAIAHPMSMIASNGVGSSLGHKNNDCLVHPRDFGSFPRVLARYAGDKKIINWEEAIYKMTGKPAEVFGINKRGTIKKKNAADIAIIDPVTVKDKSTINKPYRYPTGIEYVLVNGEIALSQGKYMDKRAGVTITK